MLWIDRLARRKRWCRPYHLPVAREDLVKLTPVLVVRDAVCMLAQLPKATRFEGYREVLVCSLSGLYQEDLSHVPILASLKLAVLG